MFPIPFFPEVAQDAFFAASLAVLFVLIIYGARSGQSVQAALPSSISGSDLVILPCLVGRVQRASKKKPLLFLCLLSF